jgi:TrmH family RNA methyltransferase
MTGTRRTVTSLQNETVKLVRSLEMRKARRETGLFVAEGASVLLTARDHGWSPRILVEGPLAAESVAARALATWAMGAGADCLDVSAAVLEKLAAKDNPQSVMAVLGQRWAELPAPDGRSGDAKAGGRARQSTGATPLPPLWIALEEVRDPGNLGTILRTADAAGATGVILVGNTCDPFSREAVRASMGSIFAVPIARAEPEAFLALAKAWQGDVVGTHLGGEHDFREADYRAPVLLVMGNEGQGLSDAAASACGKLVRIPMAGQLDSLNLAVATALMLYEIRRPSLRS